MPLLSVRDLMVFYENAIAINGLNLEVQRGQIVGVFGSNAAGKTTLMNALSGLLLEFKKREDRRGGIRITLFGRILFDGEDITSLRPAERVKRGIVVCRERHPIFPQSSVEENLRIAAYLLPSAKKRGLLDLVYTVFPVLKDLRKRRAGFLSGGEQQMLAIGMALMTGPRLLLLDEPLLGLSPFMQRQLVRAMLDIRKEGVSILVTEQFARPLLPVVERGYVVENGTPVLQGSGVELMENPEVKAAYFGI